MTFGTMSENAIVVENLSKCYLLGHTGEGQHKYTTLRDVVGRVHTPSILDYVFHRAVCYQRRLALGRLFMGISRIPNWDLLGNS